MDLDKRHAGSPSQIGNACRQPILGYRRPRGIGWIESWHCAVPDSTITDPSGGLLLDFGRGLGDRQQLGVVVAVALGLVFGVAGGGFFALFR